MILVYCDHITPRHRYIFDFVLGDVLGEKCRLVNDTEEFTSFTGPKINYSRNSSPGGIHLRPHPLLEERGITHQSLTVFKWKGLPAFFQVEEPSALPFDPFAMAFYLISRYEEYLPFEEDEHGRFRPELSLAYKENFLRIPLVDAIAAELKKIIADENPGFNFPEKPFRFIPSIDIDIAYAHFGKGWVRAAAAWAKLLLKADFGQIAERISVLAGKQSDPYDNFGLHRDLAARFGHKLIYFVLLGNFSAYDRNTSYKSNRFRKLVEGLRLTADVGLHPSYRSHLDPGKYEEEKRRLGEIINKPVTLNRFHFLRLKFPESYRLLISQGITGDFSLGYSTLNGFRAGTCTPFLFYGLDKEEITDLRLHPFIFMDSAMIDHLKMTPAEALSEIKALAAQVNLYGGEMIGIWHNYSLSEKDQYKGWQKVFTHILEEYRYLAP